MSSQKGNGDRGTELASNLFSQLLYLLGDVADCSMNIFGGEDTDLKKLAARRLVVAQQLQAILTTTNLPDPLNQPVETIVTLPHFLEELSRERTELRLSLENVEANKDNLTTLLEHARRRDENVLELIKGIKKETAAIEDEDPQEQLEEMTRLTKRVMRSFNAILDHAYPDLKADVKQILQELISLDSRAPYLPIPETVQTAAILLLVQAKVIAFDEDFQKIKLLAPRS